VIARLVQATASRWSIDQVVCDPGSNRAVIEWTVRRTGALARGAEWYEFDPGTGLITEIRAYLASPPAAGASRLELEGFPYAERGYTWTARASAWIPSRRITFQATGFDLRSVDVVVDVRLMVRQYVDG
jgi:hypothetical protein